MLPKQVVYAFQTSTATVRLPLDSSFFVNNASGSGLLQESLVPDCQPKLYWHIPREKYVSQGRLDAAPGGLAAHKYTLQYIEGARRGTRGKCVLPNFKSLICTICRISRRTPRMGSI